MHLGISYLLEAHKDRNDGKFMLEVRGLWRLNGGRWNTNKGLFGKDSEVLSAEKPAYARGRH
jgi:hypothetical protein